MPAKKKLEILNYFNISGDFQAIHPFKVGHINETYISSWNQQGSPVRYLHQKINQYVFKDVPAVMANIERAISTIKKKCSNSLKETLTIVPSKDGSTYIKDNAGDFWRTYEFLENTVSFEVCTEPRQAYQAAKVMGLFLKYLDDSDPSDYHETIVNFQNVPKRFDDLRDAIKNNISLRKDLCAEEINFALARIKDANAIEEMLRDRKIPIRITHSDPKFNNILFEAIPNKDYGDGLAVVDLDTIMPGTMLYDFGDLARSVVVAAREDETDLRKVSINKELFDQLKRGYLDAAGDVLTKDEIKLMDIAPKIIALSLGVRFLTDHLNGDVYFKVHRLNHNLDRARTQFKIVSEFENYFLSE